MRAKRPFLGLLIIGAATAALGTVHAVLYGDTAAILLAGFGWMGVAIMAIRNIALAERALQADHRG